MIELRFDLLNLNEDDFQTLIANVPTSWIATCRKSGFSNDERNKILSDAIMAGADYIDLELEMDACLKNDLVRKAKAQGTKIIHSWHDFQKTPQTDELILILNQLKQLDPDLLKMVSFCNSEDDAETILGLYQFSENILAFGMGEYGRATRIKCLRLGAPYTYTSLSETSNTAPGQLDYATMQTMSEINSRHRTK